MLPIATYLRKFSSCSVEEYCCYPNYGPWFRWGHISLRKCVRLSTQAPFGMIPVVGKLGSYSNLQHKKISYRVEIFAPSILWIPDNTKPMRRQYSRRVIGETTLSQWGDSIQGEW
jgi:hypothetical protein